MFYIAPYRESEQLADIERKLLVFIAVESVRNTPARVQFSLTAKGHELKELVIAVKFDEFAER